MRLPQAILLLFCCWVAAGLAAKKSSNLVQTFEDHKEFKKLLRTKNNVLVTFFSGTTSKEIQDFNKILKELAHLMKGKGTVATVDCSSGDGGKKLCKKLKVSPGGSGSKDGGGEYVIKHYKDGEFHLNYSRPKVLKSMLTFMRDPTGDMPWDEDKNSGDVTHVTDVKHFNSLLKKDHGRIMMMFYAPWCGFCKRMKPDYQLAAKELKGKHTLVAIDVTKPENGGLSKKYNVTGFPTLLFFDQGQLQYPYPGDNTRKAIVDFMESPSEKAPEKLAEPSWKDEPSEVVHLTDATFDDFLSQESSLLIMFYAPWCGHCKTMKPQFNAAAGVLAKTGAAGKLAAVDCTTESQLAKRFEVKSYPTVKYFKDGEFAFAAGHARDEAEIIKFMDSPSEPPPPPPPETPWSEEQSDVAHLTEENFKPFLKKKKHVLVMFYAPWCGHCKRAKPEMSSAATHFADNPKVELAAMDCTLEKTICSLYDVTGFPTFKYFKYYDKQPVKSYDGGRSSSDFIKFLEDPESPLSAGQQPAPSAQSAEEQWAGFEGAQFVQHLTDADFEKRLAGVQHALVLFYAPWCGHCKAMKGDYAGAAQEIWEASGSSLALAAVDATVHPTVTGKHNIRGYPTLKYFKAGQFVEDYKGGRKRPDLFDYLKKKLRDEL